MTFKLNTKYEILTENGFSKFFGLQFKEDRFLEIITESGKSLKCSYNHYIKTKYKFKKAKSLKIGNLVKTKDGLEKIVSINKNDKSLIKLYDPVNVKLESTYYSNNIISHNCSFEGTGETYIDNEILVFLTQETSNDYSIKYNNRMRVWEDPVPNHEYALGIDCSIGRQRDYSAFHIIDIYNGRQVAEFYSNRTPINEFAKIITDEARLYNTAFVLPERNTIGNNLIYFLKEVNEYENLVMDDSAEIGIQITQKNRETLLADMEHCIRSGRIKINSERLVKELLTFIIDPDTGKIKADSNCHDDLIMSLCVTVKIFNDLRQNMLIERDSLYDKNPINPGILVSTKYKMKTATGGISEEDIEWLLKN